MLFIGKTDDILMSFDPKQTVGIVSIMENGQFTYSEQYTDGTYDITCMRFMRNMQCFVWDYTDLVNLSIYELGSKPCEK